MRVGKSKALPTQTARGKAKPAPILDLDHAASDDDDFDEGLGDMEKEAKSLEALQNQYGHCQSCGRNKACKIAVDGTHYPITNNQLRAWSKSLVCHSIAANTRLSLIISSGLGHQRRHVENSTPRRRGTRSIWDVFQKLSRSDTARHTPTSTSRWYEPVHDALRIHDTIAWVGVPPGWTWSSQHARNASPAAHCTDHPFPRRQYFTCIRFEPHGRYTFQ